MISDEVKILQNQIDSMSAIFNAIPGETFHLDSSDTLLILQRRMQKSDLLEELCKYNEIFAKVDGASIGDIEKSATAFIRIQILAKAESDTYTPIILRQLIKEYKAQITKVTNIIHLSRVNALTADDYQKEIIKCMEEKNEAFLVAFQREIERLEKVIERNPVLESHEIKYESAKKKSEVMPKRNVFGDVFQQICSLKSNRKAKLEVEQRLRDEEKKRAITSCEEIPFYDDSLTFTEIFCCKDIPSYSLMKRKDNVYFGLSKNVGKSNYNNKDHSLIELTRVKEEFLQFMTEDLLTGEYELQSFSTEDKDAMRMYFEFMSRCFENHIGVTITVQEYLKFKDYYNRLVLRMFELERQEKEDYYKALMLTDMYFTYMKSYDLQPVAEQECTIADLMKENNEVYLDDLELILQNHIVDEKAKADLITLKEKIRGFHKKEAKNEVEVLEKPKETIMPIPAVSLGDYGIQGYPMPVIANGVMQIVVQILNQNHEVIDEALYAGNNIKQALFDYESKQADIKRLGLRSNGTDVFYKEEIR